MPEQGWVCAWREIKNWRWYKTRNMAHFFQHLFREANHDKREWQGAIIERGQIVCGRLKLAEETGLTVQEVRTCITRLKSTGEITIKTTSRFSIITIVNYNTYQNKDITINHIINHNSNQQLTNNQPTTNHKQQCKQLNNDNKKNPSLSPLNENPPVIEATPEEKATFRKELENKGLLNKKTT